MAGLRITSRREGTASRLRAMQRTARKIILKDMGKGPILAGLVPHPIINYLAGMPKTESNETYIRP